MACIDLATNEDICAPFGVQTNNHEDCWVGMDESDNQIPGRGVGCEVGCSSCVDQPGDLYGDNLIPSFESPRFLAAHPTLPGRDALGRVGDVLGGRWMKVPRQYSAIRGTCWANDGTECFGDSVCKCFPRTDPSSDCIEGQQIPGFFPDEFFFAGNRWPPKGGVPQFHCRSFRDENNHTASAAVETDLMEPIVMRASQHFAANQPMGCAVNWMVLCHAQAPTSNCFGSFNQGSELDPFPYYNDKNECRNIFHSITIDRNTVELISPDDPAVGLKNLILLKARSSVYPEDIVRFDRLDYKQPGDGNPGLNGWGRGFDGTGLAFDMLPKVTVISGRAKYAGCPMLIEIAILKVRMELALVPLKQKQRGQGDEIFLHARMRQTVEIASRASFVGGACQYERDWMAPDDPNRTGELFIDTSGRHSSIIGDDEIEYTYGGETISLPHSVVWEGFRGVATGATPQPFVDSGFNICRSLANNMTPTVIQGWPTGIDGFQYGGDVQVGFRTNLEGCE